MKDDNMSENIEELEKTEEEMEELLKACPRCGAASKNKSNPAGRCASCLKKLASNKKKVGHYLHEHKIADDALRRQKGKNGTAHKKTKGLASRKQIIDKVHKEEKKAGQVVSLDRKSNSKGYTPSNVRGVDPKLNRGRHKVDPKKLAAWRKKMKKNNMTLDDLKAILLEKTAEDEQVDLIKALIEIFEDELDKVEAD